jgi:tryptophan synthase alpha chain
MALERAFDDDPAFVPYLAAGDPSPEATVEYVKALVRGGADAVELGLPFSEPIAEGSTIQSAIVRSLDGGMTPDRFMNVAAEIDAAVDVPLVVMTYYNLIYQFGDGAPPDGGDHGRDYRAVEPFVAAAAKAGIEGVIVPDLPVDESEPLRAACAEYGLDLVFIVAPTTTDGRLDRMLQKVSGYLYVQARLGTTGAREDVSDRTAASLDRLDGVDVPVPTAVGFGIKTGDHAAEVVRAGADGVIVGSAIVDLVAEGVENDAPTAEVTDRLEAKARELKTGALRGARTVPKTEPPTGSPPPEGK